MTWREESTEVQGEGPTCPLPDAARRDGKCSIFGNHRITHRPCIDSGDCSKLTRSTKPAYLLTPHIYKVVRFLWVRRNVFLIS